MTGPALHFAATLLAVLGLAPVAETWPARPERQLAPAASTARQPELPPRPLPAVAHPRAHRQGATVRGERVVAVLPTLVRVEAPRPHAALYTCPLLVPLSPRVTPSAQRDPPLPCS